MPAPGPLFTPETARAASKLGAAARKRRADMLTRLDDISARLARLERNGHRRNGAPSPLQPSPWPPAPPPQPLNDAPPADPGEFALWCIERVRANLKRLHLRLSVEQDPLAIDRISRATSALAEQLRILEGKPLPGQRRPGREKADPPSVEARPLGRVADPVPMQPVECAPISSSAPPSVAPIAPTTEPPPE